jgi:hypothetical protein
MDRLHELISVLSDREVQARTFYARHICICKICQKPAKTFKSPFSEHEYRLSAICEECQNYFSIIPDCFK